MYLHLFNVLKGFLNVFTYLLSFLFKIFLFDYLFIISIYIFTYFYFVLRFLTLFFYSTIIFIFTLLTYLIQDLVILFGIMIARIIIIYNFKVKYYNITKILCIQALSRVNTMNTKHANQIFFFSSGYLSSFSYRISKPKSVFPHWCFSSLSEESLNNF